MTVGHAPRTTPGSSRRPRGRAVGESRIRSRPGSGGWIARARGSSTTSSTGLASIYGRDVWQRRLDPTSELILTILTQNTADVNAEKAFEALRAGLPLERPRGAPSSRGWAGVAPGSRRARRPTGWRSRPRRCRSSSTSSDPAVWGRRRRPASRPRCAPSARRAATTRSSSWATWRRSKRATG